uniref:Uncharacterized protein n=1 Tax=Aegilops tauschii subsp. strangulata TaxID=200361 RepID=A0A453S3Y7_AEGTS
MKVALLCMQATPLRRRSMPQVLEMLEREDVRVREKELTLLGYIVMDNKDSHSTSMVVASHIVTELAPR